MPEIILEYSTGSTEADNLLRAIVNQFETSFPNRLRSYYVEGSYADQTAVATSDLDITLVFRHEFIAAEQEAANHLMEACKQHSCIEIDSTIVEETQLRQQADPMFKVGARLLYGTDIRPDIPLMPLAIWTHQRMHAAFWLMSNVFHRPKPVRIPITFPEPAADFLGYCSRMMRLSNGQEIPTTRNLIRVTGWIATARIAYEGQQYVTRKRDSIATYQQLINDEWTSLLEQIDRRCRTAWQYRIPEARHEQVELRTILEKTLAFENHFLSVYRRFLLAELTGLDSSKQQGALRILNNTFFADPAIIDAVNHLQDTDNREVRTAAQQLSSSMNQQ